MERKGYPVFIKQAENDFLVYVPDFDIYTGGKDFEDALEMARDVITLKCASMKDHSEFIPKASNQEEALRKAKDKANNIFDYSDGTLSFVDI